MRPISGSRSCGGVSRTTTTPRDSCGKWADEEGALRARIVAARALLPEVRLGDGALRQIAATCAAFEVDGMRADIVMARTATALAAWAGRTDVLAEDVRQAALLALPHRRRRNPFDAPGLDEDKLDDTLEQNSGEDEDPDPDGPGGGGRPPQGDGPDTPPQPEGESGDTPAQSVPEQGQEQEQEQGRSSGAGEQQPVRAAEPFRTKMLSVPGLGEGAAGRRSRARTEHGRTTGARRPRGALTKLHLAATVQAAAPHQRARGRSGRGLVVRRDDLRQATRGGARGEPRSLRGGRLRVDGCPAADECREGCGALAAAGRVSAAGQGRADHLPGQGRRSGAAADVVGGRGGGAAGAAGDRWAHSRRGRAVEGP